MKLLRFIGFMIVVVLVFFFTWVLYAYRPELKPKKGGCFIF